MLFAITSDEKAIITNIIAIIITTIITINITTNINITKTTYQQCFDFLTLPILLYQPDIRNALILGHSPKLLPRRREYFGLYQL